jgi:ElaB/YqjD/DUF883 family membrane-anchored ribosome-binding protein
MSAYGVRESAMEGIVGAVTRNPEGLLLLAAGAALLLRSGRGQSSVRYAAAGEVGYRAHTFDNLQETNGIGERVGKAARRAGEHLSEATGRAGDYVSDATEKVSETARSYASSALGYADEATRVAAEQSRRMADHARETADYVVREQPWGVALAGLVVGAAVAAVFAPTRIEKRTLGGVGQRLRSAAEVVGARVMEAGMQAGERLSEVAEERGLTKEGLKEAARDVGETFGSALGTEEGSGPQASNRRQSDEGIRPKTTPRQAQSGPTSTHSSKSSRPPSPTSPSGGRT